MAKKVKVEALIELEKHKPGGDPFDMDEETAKKLQAKGIVKIVPITAANQKTNEVKE